jgi:predicted aspartyl protease
MAIDFPASPTNGQTFTSGALVYTYDGTKWTAQPAGVTGGTKIEVGNTKAEIVDTGSDGRFVVTTEGSERLRVNSAGEIGLAGANYGTSGQVLTSGGTGAAPTWSTPAAADKISEGNTSAEVIDTGSDGRFVVTTEGTERARIDSSGAVSISATSATTGGLTADCVNVSKNVSSNPLFKVYNASGGPSNSNGLVAIHTLGSQSSSFSFLSTFTSDTSDREHNLRGDGQAYADQSWNASGADYAEYFEWSDGNPEAEDRRGISVVLEGDTIRPALEGEDPLGVISGNPSVVGDAAWNKWSGKYLRDDYGTYIRDENGERQLNPAYDPDAEYIPREQRPEWDCVGLMGKLRIRKGQPTGSRWIKMRDISDSIEEWLVR